MTHFRHAEATCIIPTLIFSPQVWASSRVENVTNVKNIISVFLQAKLKCHFKKFTKKNYPETLAHWQEN